MKLFSKEKDGNRRIITLLGIKFKYKKDRNFVEVIQEEKSDITVDINFSNELIRLLENHVSNISESIDSNHKNSFVRCYLDIQPHIARVKSLIQTLDITENHKVLEVGSGIGTSSVVLRALTQADIVGIEPAYESYSLLIPCIEKFKEDNQHLPYENINCYGENIPYPDESFDLIYSFDVFEHVQDPKAVFAQIYRLLKKGGKAFISTNNYDSFYEGHYRRFWNPFISVEKNKQNYIKKGLSPKFFEEINFITKKDIKKYVKEQGYKSISFDPPFKVKKIFNDLNLVYPSEYVWPEVKSLKARKLHRFIESPKIAKFLAKFDRDYKLNFIIEK